MADGETIDRFLVELVGDARPLVEAVESAMAETERIFATKGKRVVGVLMEEMRAAFASDLPEDMDKIFERVGVGMTMLGQDLQTAVQDTVDHIGLLKVETDATVDSVLAKFQELQNLFDTDVQEGFAKLEQAMSDAGIEIDANLTRRMSDVALATRKVSESTAEYHENLKTIIPIAVQHEAALRGVQLKTEQLTQATEAVTNANQQATVATDQTKKKTEEAGAAQEQTRKQVEKSSKGWKGLARSLLATFGLINIGRQVLRFFSEALSNGVKIIMEANDGNNALAISLRKIEQATQAAQVAAAAAGTPFIILAANIKKAATELLFLAIRGMQTFMRDVVPAMIRSVHRLIGTFGLWGEVLRRALNPFEKQLTGEEISRRLEEIEAAAQAAGKKMQDTAQQWIDNTDAVIQASIDMVEPVKQAFVKIKKAMEDAERDLAKGLEDIQEKLNQTLADINRDLNRDIIDAQADLQRDLADLDRETAEERAEAIHDSHVEEQRETEDHYDKLRELENKFLLDLQDAVRERDARQVLMLIRRFNLEKNQLENDYDKRQRRRREDLALELADLERQRQQKRSDLFRDFEEEIENLRLQAERRRVDAMADADRQRAQLRKNINDRLTELGRGLAAELKLTHDQLSKLRTMLLAAYGPNGWVLAIYRGAANAISQMSMAPGSGGGAFGGGGGGGAFAMQRGGEFVATSPTLFSAGEGRPERVSVSPLSNSGSPSAGFRDGNGRGSLEVSIALEDGLRAEITDEAMSNLSDVIVSITKVQGKGKGR